MATWYPAVSIIAVMPSAIIVLPQPTSPCTSASSRFPLATVLHISCRVVSWSFVRSKLSPFWKNERACLAKAGLTVLSVVVAASYFRSCISMQNGISVSATCLLFTAATSSMFWGICAFCRNSFNETISRDLRRYSGIGSSHRMVLLSSSAFWMQSVRYSALMPGSLL